MVILDDALHRQAKRFAAQHGRTLSQLIGEALHLRLASPNPPAGQELPPLPVCHAGGGLRPGLSLEDMKTIYDAMDEGLPIEKLK